MSSKEISIRISDISKCYQIYAKPTDRLKQFFIPKIQSILGRLPGKFYNEFWALKNINFEIKKGETIGIVGRNGSGKSTLLQIISGTLTPTNGTVEILGRVAALLELGSGFNPEFSGKENIYLNASILGLSRTEIEGKYEEIVAFADIGHFIDQPVKTYSSGMYVRLAFSVAISVEPDILIVDEALAVGDPSFQAKCMQKFEEFRQKGTTILLVTHDLGAILQFSDRCLLLDNGNKIEVSDPKAAVDSFKKLLLGVPSKSINNRELISGRLRELANSDWASNYTLNIGGTEIYGNGKVKIADFGIFDESNNVMDSKLELGQVYLFKMLIAFNESVDNPIFTLTIRDLTGKEIVGTNTRNERVVTGHIAKNALVEVAFMQKLRLAPGNYLLTYACSGFEGDDFVVYERLYHVLVIEVYGYKQVVGHYDMEPTILINKMSASI